MEKLKTWAESFEQKYAKYLIFAILIPVFAPRGFSECWGWYKTFWNLWMYLALAIIGIWFVYDLFIRGLHYKPCAYAVAVYYAAFILITLIVQKGISEGLQKLFAGPAIILFCMMQLKNDPKRFLRSMAYVLFVILALNISVFSPLMLKFYGLLGDRLFFLGHIQVAAQYGILGVLVAFLLHSAYKERPVICAALAAVSLITMLWANTDAGMLVTLILVAGLILWLMGRFPAVAVVNRCLMGDLRYSLVGYLLMTELLLLYTVGNHYVFFGIDLSFSGRTIVWTEVLRLFSERPVFGYGAYGVLIQTFWTTGMNYAHSEFMQKLLDGGLVLCILYYFMLATLLAPVRKVKKQKVRFAATICLLAMFLVMLFESVGDYFYTPVFFAIFAYFPEIFTKRTEQGGQDQIAGRSE